MPTAELERETALTLDPIIESDILEMMDRKGPDPDGRFRLIVPMDRVDGVSMASVKVELDVDPADYAAHREWCEHAARVVGKIREATAGDAVLLDLCEPHPLYCTWLGRGVRIDMQGDGFEATNLDTATADVASMLRKYAARCIAAADRLDAAE